jgi:hypothetical protein
MRKKKYGKTINVFLTESLKEVYSMLKAINIKWDIDDDLDILQMLPKEIKIPKGMTDEDEISDYLSNVTGYCHKGFTLVKEV